MKTAPKLSHNQLGSAKNLLCIATAKSSIVTEANRMIASFVAGQTSKTDVLNFGYLR